MEFAVLAFGFCVLVARPKLFMHVLSYHPQHLAHQHQRGNPLTMGWQISEDPQTCREVVGGYWIIRNVTLFDRLMRLCVVVLQV